MKNNRFFFGNGLTIIVFIIIISFPLLDTFFSFTGENKNIENRRLQKMPEFHIKAFKLFFTQFELYFNENFRPRTALFQAYSFLKVNALKTSPNPTKVIIGKDGWFFLGDGDGMYNAMKDYRCTIPLYTDELNDIVQQVKANKTYLDSLNI